MQQLQWFPGHMAKTRKQISSDIKLVDVVIELLDARIPVSSANPMLPELIRSKKRLTLLNKADLADEAESRQWISRFKEQGVHSLCINSTENNKYTKQIYAAVLQLCKDKLERNIKRGIKNTTIKAMVVGIPNVGKSTLINSISNRAAAKTGNRPGVTTASQWIRLNKDIELLDTPGILWPKFESEEVGRHLAFIGSIRDDIIDIADLSYYLIETLNRLYPEALIARYNIEPFSDPLDALNAIARVRSCLKKGGEYNLDAAAKLLLDDFRKGRLGRISLEKAYADK